MISRKDVHHLARLARLALTDAEADKLGDELSKILDFVAELEKLDTADIQPLAGGTDLSGIMRDDTPGISAGGASGQALIERAPRRRGQHVEVRAVFERN